MNILKSNKDIFVKNTAKIKKKKSIEETAVCIILYYLIILTQYKKSHS